VLDDDHPVLAEEKRWDAVTERIIGPDPDLIGVSRWIGDSRTYAADNNRIALLRSTGVRTWSGEAPLASELEMLNHLGVDAELVSEDGFEALLSPRLEGTSLDRLQGGLNLVDRAKVVWETARALRRLHARQIAHRDIRADNLISSSDDLKLIDFDQAVLGNRLTVGLADWIGIGPRGLSPNPFWKFALFIFVPKSQSVGQRLRTRLLRRRQDWMSPPPSERDLHLLAEAWKIAQSSRANAPGQGFAYYAFTYKGWHFPGERPWYLRWDPIRRVVSFDGKRVVDLGANMGLFSSFALLHGARAVVGVDHDAEVLRAAALVAEAFGTEPVLKHRDLVESPDWEREVGVGDIVSCTSVRHWLADDSRLSLFLSAHPEIIYEGHGTLEEETSYLQELGFERPQPLVQTERGRYLLYARKSA
jgi:2-polyprenyl-3-methyl-5-hydroxy-6-metoxy-1,4-benzoquinol methylase